MLGDFICSLPSVTHRDMGQKERFLIQAYMVAVFIHVNSGPDVSAPNLLGFIYLKGKTPVFHLCRHLTLSFEGYDRIRDLQVNLNVMIWARKNRRTVHAAPFPVERALHFPVHLSRQFDLLANPLVGLTSLLCVFKS